LSKILGLSRDSTEKEKIYTQLHTHKDHFLPAVLEMAEYSLEKRDTLFPVADMQELIQVNLPSYYKGRACLLLARYYDVISPQLDSTWEYLHKAKSHFESPGTITRDYVDCLQYLSEHSTYHRKNLLAIRYANIPCEF